MTHCNLWFRYEMPSQKIHVLKAHSPAGDVMERGLDQEDRLTHQSHNPNSSQLLVHLSLFSFQLPRGQHSLPSPPGYYLMFWPRRQRTETINQYNYFPLSFQVFFQYGKANIPQTHAFKVLLSGGTAAYQ